CGTAVRRGSGAPTSGKLGHYLEPKLFARAWTLCIVSLLVMWAGLWVFQQAEWRAPAEAWETFRQWGRFHLPRVNEDSSLLWILCPTVLVLAWAGSLLLLYDQPPDWLRLPVGLVFLFLQL